MCERNITWFLLVFYADHTYMNEQFVITVMLMNVISKANNWNASR